MGSIASRLVGWVGGVLLSIIAFAVVFLVIAVLMFMMMALKRVSRWINSLGTTGAAAEKPTSGQAGTAPAIQGAAQAVPASGDDSELIAVLTAAITAAIGGGAAVLSYAPAAAHAQTNRSAVPAWRMDSIMDNSATPRN